ncbi:tannase/feruloyl esterase family alpha/beta hydrolase [Roseateles koreensis]|uniref:Tannase/feruloyl esterase family alpha/beta hydrolase n=1 Tax=Roseateles koreensis TaxID=2987526 RepID=A0ABT5KNC7_9BURK|nr:tannase/feruloyl esterase family alpha/beta hydrolase [Roseateles koreensis]MDC8784389.1 tannase/feruloyl esterase family alpha/beta hydrolase [Roseateles koreensis]
MDQKFPHRTRALWLAPPLTAIALAGCGGGDGEPPLPQLSAAQAAVLAGTCEALATKLGSLADTTITATTSVAAGLIGTVATPDHCLVKGEMLRRTSTVDGKSYAIGFEMRLPKNWNGRYYYQANGGIDGSVVPATGALGGGPLTGALTQGFAVMSSDAGHSNAAVGGPAFGIDPQARLDYGYQADAKLLPTAKEVIRQAYGKVPDRSYYGGCSNGGRHTLVAAARYGDQYDGYLAGAPGYNLPKAAVANIAGAQLFRTISNDPTSNSGANLATAWTAAERALLSSRVAAKCDALDGAVDGLVQDTTACQSAFNLQTDVPTCTGARDGTCLTAAQKAAVAGIFGGLKTSAGALVYSSFPFDTGHGTPGVANWKFNSPVQLDSGAVGLIFKVPPLAGTSTADQLATWALTTSIDSMVAEINATNATYTESAMSFMTPPNPTNLATVKNRGAKMLVYHGVSDPIFSVNDTQAWYDGLRSANGGDASNFARFFRVPGMNHCSGGPAADQFDMLSKLVTWVEQGQAPESITATVRGAGNAGGANADLPSGWSPSRSRPLCPYPKVAKYIGSGDIESADNFRCE